MIYQLVGMQDSTLCVNGMNDVDPSSAICSCWGKFEQGIEAAIQPIVKTLYHAGMSDNEVMQMYLNGVRSLKTALDCSGATCASGSNRYGGSRGSVESPGPLS